MSWLKTCGPVARRVASLIAAEHGFALEDICGRSQKPDIVHARFAAIYALSKGGYARKEIAKLVNRSYAQVAYAIRAHEGKLRRKAPTKIGAPRAQAARDQLAARLEWQYGQERAKAILEGRDPATEADIAAWRNLGRHAEEDTRVRR